MDERGAGRERQDEGSQQEKPAGRQYQTLLLTLSLEGATGICRHFLHGEMGLGMKLGVTESHDCLMLPDSAVTAWPLAHAILG